MDIIKKSGGVGSFKFAGSIDCSGNPNYPAGDAGDVYIISVAGKIGGASGLEVDMGDFVICEVDGTPSGTQAEVGANWTLIKASQSITYTGTAAIDVGGIASGTSFSMANMQTMWDRLINPYLSPLVSLAVSPSAGYNEHGVPIASVDLTPTTTKKTLPITTLTLSRSGTGVIHTYSPPNPNGGTEATYTDSVPVEDTTTYTATVGDGSTTATNTKTYTFIYPYFYGSHADGTTESDIEAMTKVVLPPTNNLTLSFTPTAERVYFAVPPGATAYTHVYDQNLFDVSADFLPSTTMSITGPDGLPQTYTIYEIDHDIGTGIPLTFKFVY